MPNASPQGNDSEDGLAERHIDVKEDPPLAGAVQRRSLVQYQWLGSLEEGKEATLIAVKGDLFSFRAQVRRAWIAGREVSLEDRQRRLYERYRQRPRQR